MVSGESEQTHRAAVWGPFGVPSKVSLSEAIDSFGFGCFQIILAAGLGTALVADSMEIMIMAVLGPMLQCSWSLQKTSIALVTTSVFWGYAISSPLWGYASDRFGRKRSLIAASVLLTIFGFSSAFAPSFEVFLVLRFICGCCISCQGQCFVLLAEFLPSRSRGQASTFMLLVWACGGVMVILIAWAMATTPEHWRTLLLFPCP